MEKCQIVLDILGFGYLSVWVSKKTPQHSNTFIFVNAHAENVLVDLGKDSEVQLN